MVEELPTRIAVLGAGPIGLEVALYSRYLGYRVDIYERGSVADNVRRWGHVRMFSPFRTNRSTLGLAALEAQELNGQLPADDALLTGNQWSDHYLTPLAKTDLIADSLHEQTTVLSIGRQGPLKGNLIGDASRADFPFRILLREQFGIEKMKTADVVIDTTGTYGNHNWAGQGGIPAVGELALEGHIEYGVVDLLGAEREQYAGQHVLLIGAGYSAATSVVSLAELARSHPETHILWITQGAARSQKHSGPIQAILEDRLPERESLTTAANRLTAHDASPNLLYCPETVVDRIARDERSNRFTVCLSGTHAGEVQVDRIIANVGYHPDREIFRELQVHECYASEGPIKLAAELMRNPSEDCLNQISSGPDSLLNPEPNFFILGSKSYGRGSQFLYSFGLQQIKDLFTIICGRCELDLYRSIKHTLSDQ